MGTEGRCSIDLSANVGKKDLASIDVDSFPASVSMMLLNRALYK